jgi:hypothetical protein
VTIDNDNLTVTSISLIISRCIEAGLKPFLNKVSAGFIAEAVKPLLVLEKDKDRELVESCVALFSSNMRRHLLCLETKAK